MSETFGARLRRLREDADVTRIQFADIICATADNVRQWEYSSSYPRPLMLPSIARALNVSVDYLLTGEESRKVSALYRAIRSGASRSDLLLMVPDHD